MRNTFSRSITALVAVASSVQAISLSSFTPVVRNLPSSCQTAYTTTVAGCQASDFSSRTCSSSCVSGLITISQLVRQQCANAKVDSESIIGVFLAGNGIPALCPNIQVTTIAASPSPTAQKTSTRLPASSTLRVQSSSQAETTDAPSSSPEASSAASSTLESSSTATFIAVDSSSATLDSQSTSTPSPKPSQTSNSQKSNIDSGGGSPFDITATGAGAGQRCETGVSALVASTILMLAMALYR